MVPRTKKTQRRMFLASDIVYWRGLNDPTRGTHFNDLKTIMGENHGDLADATSQMQANGLFEQRQDPGSRDRAGYRAGQPLEALMTSDHRLAVLFREQVAQAIEQTFTPQENQR